MNKIIGFLVMVFMFLPWRPIVAIVAAVLFVNINGTELYEWQADRKSVGRERVF